MKKLIKSLFLMSLLVTAQVASAQVVSPGERVPQGSLIYSLPSTSFHIVAESSRESFTAGPYARFAQKYLGIDARTESGDFYRLTSVALTPYVEADKSANIAINIGNSKNASANFLEFTNQGLIIWSDTYSGKNEKMRFPQMNDRGIFEKSMATSNLTSEKTVLYKTVQTASGFEKVPVQQSQTVEKSLEKRAEETANMIFKLRAKRMEIITGETDATFSGEAMKAVIDEINRLESDYLSLFTGKSKIEKQTMSFDVAPSADNGKQIYIAFRFSDREGIVSADIMTGRPVVLQLTDSGEKMADLGMDNAQAKTRLIFYRKPAIMNVKLTDGQTQLLQARVPVYQLGKLLTFPIEVSVAK